MIFVFIFDVYINGYYGEYIYIYICIYSKRRCNVLAIVRFGRLIGFCGCGNRSMEEIKEHEKEYEKEKEKEKEEDEKVDESIKDRLREKLLRYSVGKLNTKLLFFFVFLCLNHIV